MSRFENRDWDLPTQSDGTVRWEAVHSALLMDLRDELRRIRTTMECPNTAAIPNILRGIRSNTRRPLPRSKRKRAKETK